MTKYHTQQKHKSGVESAQLNCANPQPLGLLCKESKRTRESGFSSQTPTGEEINTKKRQATPFKMSDSKYQVNYTHSAVV